jgi:hypothetical protein
MKGIYIYICIELEGVVMGNFGWKEGVQNWSENGVAS